jgi:hypothetical protein
MVVDEASVRARGRWDDDEGDVAPGHRLGDVGGRAEAALRGVDQVLEPGLVDRRDARVDGSDGAGAQIDADHPMPLAGRHGRQRRAELAQADDRHGHGGARVRTEIFLLFHNDGPNQSYRRAPYQIADNLKRDHAILGRSVKFS